MLLEGIGVDLALLICVDLRINSNVSDFSGPMGGRVVGGSGWPGPRRSVLDILHSDRSMAPEVALLNSLVLNPLNVIKTIGLFSTN